MLVAARLLTYVDIADITELPPQFSKLDLETLCLGKTGFSSYPQCISRLSCLRRLDLHGIRLSAIPESIGILLASHVVVTIL